MVRSPARTTAALLAAVVVLAGCDGAEVAVEDVPVVTAVPVPFEASGLAPPEAPGVEDGTATPQPTATSSPSPSPSPTSTIGPSSADAAAFVRGPDLDDLAGVEHVVVDLDGDTWAEVVATGVRDRVGVLRVAWWTVDGYEVLAEDEAGAGRTVTDLRAADVNGDGLVEVLVAVEGEGLRSLAVWSVVRRGVVEALVASGGCHDGSHVFGVTRARLEDGGGGPPTIVADCDDSPLPVADWSEQRWSWDGDAYRIVQRPTPAPTPSPPPPVDLGEDDVDRGGEPAPVAEE